MIVVLLDMVQVHIERLPDIMLQFVVDYVGMLWLHLQDQVASRRKDIFWVENASV